MKSNDESRTENCVETKDNPSPARRGKWSVSREKLNLIDELLLASGWRQEPEGWLAPKAFQEQLALEVGEGHLCRSLAMRAQIQVDEAICTAVKDPRFHTRLLRDGLADSTR